MVFWIFDSRSSPGQVWGRRQQWLLMLCCVPCPLQSPPAPRAKAKSPWSIGLSWAGLTKEPWVLWGQQMPAAAAPSYISIWYLPRAGPCCTSPMCSAADWMEPCARGWEGQDQRSVEQPPHCPGLQLVVCRWHGSFKWLPRVEGAEQQWQSPAQGAHSTHIQGPSLLAPCHVACTHLTICIYISNMHHLCISSIY